MKYKAVLFDLDGTLLPMNQEEFTKAYFGGLVKKLAPLGYQADSVISAVWSGVKAMILNDGKRLNCEAFWMKFTEILGEKVLEDRPLLDEYYQTDFDKVRELCGFAPESAEIIKALKNKGVRVVLATNPLVFAILLTIFLIIVIGTKFVSLGSVMCVMIYPYLLSKFEAGPNVLSGIVIAALVVFMHRSNIKRLLAGTESKISLKSKKKAPKEENTEEENDK